MDSRAAGQMATFQSKLCENYDLLSRCLIVSPGLLMKLKSVDYMRDKVPQIRQLTTAEQKVAELLNILDEVPDSQHQSVFSTLLPALRQDGQEHVANIFCPESNARPMSDEHYQLLVSKQQQVCRSLDPLNGILDELIVKQVFSQKNKNNVLALPGHDDMSAEIINGILRKPDSAFDKFISALIETKQEHVASLLGHKTTNIPMTVEHRLLLISKKDDLVEFINPTCTFLSKLEAVGILNNRDIGKISSKSGYTEISIELVNILLRKSDSSFDKFIEVLHNTEQQHVVHILTGQGEPPLSHLRRLVLRKARDRLVTKVDIQHTSLVAKLISSGVLTDADKQRIESHDISEDRTAQLIDLITRKSHVVFDKFIDALKGSGHREVAEFLEGLELRGLIDPHFLSNTLLPDRKRIVQFLRNDLQALVTGSGDAVKIIAGLMEQNGFAVSEINEGSITISFICFTEESLENLKRLYSDKTLDKLLTEVFCPPFADQGLESLTLRITDSEFQTLAEAFSLSLHIIDDEFHQIAEASTHIRLFEMQQTLNILPLELLELVLMKTFLKQFNDNYKSHYKTHEAIRLVYSTLAVVCSNWWQTMNGWPQSPTKHWFKHKLQRALTFVCRPYVVSPRLQSSLSVSSEYSAVSGVTVCDNKLFVVCEYSNSILVFGPNNKQQTTIELEQLNNADDIVSCTETQRLYVADESRDSTRCVWRVSLDGRQVVKWLPNKSTTTSQFSPHTLSVTSRRLLVTSQSKKELLLYGADGLELKRVPLPDMTSLKHAVETSRETFVVSHSRPQPRVCEVNVDGQVTRVYCDQQQLYNPFYMSLDSDGRIFVADYNKHHVLLLNSETLKLERVLLDTQQHQLTQFPRRLCYIEQTGQLAVSGAEYDVLTGECVSPQLFTVRRSTASVSTTELQFIIN